MSRPDFRSRYGPWALIAGASEGLGAEFALQLAIKGFNLVLVARRQAQLDKLSSQLDREHRIEIRTLALDLAREDAGTVLANATSDLEIGLLIYNAAVSMIGPYLEISLEDHQREIEVNCRTPSVLVYLFGKKMVQRQRGGIILMSSMSALQGSALVTNYGATKAFNRILAEGLWDELRELGVDVLASCPAPVNTPGYLSSEPKNAPPALQPDVVVSEALKALGKGPVNVPGFSWRLATFFVQRLIPHTSAIKIIGNSTRKMYGSR